MGLIMIEGIQLYPMKQITNPKGDLYHVLHATDAGYAGFGEAYFSYIKEGVVKGWKRHNRITLNIVVPVGEIKFVVYDDRKDSPTRGQYEEFILSPTANYKRLTVPPGLWLAFVGLGKGQSLLLDIIPEVHDEHEASRLELDKIPYNFNL